MRRKKCFNIISLEFVTYITSGCHWRRFIHSLPWIGTLNETTDRKQKDKNKHCKTQVKNKQKKTKQNPKQTKKQRSRRGKITKQRKELMPDKQTNKLTIFILPIQMPGVRLLSPWHDQATSGAARGTVLARPQGEAILTVTEGKPIMPRRLSSATRASAAHVLNYEYQLCEPPQIIIIQWL